MGAAEESPSICDYEGSDYRTAFWEGRGREYEDAVERHAIRRLLPPTGRRLLDIGAGFGRLADLYGGYERVILLDYSRSQLQYARQRLGDARYLYVAADIYRLPLATAAVDAIVMVRVLHHLADVPLAMQRIAHACRRGGTLVLEQANKRHVKNILQHLRRRGPDPNNPQPHEFAPLHYDFHPAWVAQRLRESGFRPQARRSVSLFRHPTLKRRLPTRLLIALDAALQRVTAPWTPGPSVFWRARAEGGSTALAPDHALFRCPRCAAEPLSLDAGGVACVSCGARYPLRDGILDFKDDADDAAARPPAVDANG